MCNTYVHSITMYKCTHARCTSEPPLGKKHVCGGLRAVGQQPDKAHPATKDISQYICSEITFHRGIWTDNGGGMYIVITGSRYKGSSLGM